METTNQKPKQTPLLDNQVGHSDKLKLCSTNWSKITNDPVILTWIQGYEIPFSELPPPHDSGSQHWTNYQKQIVELEINKLISFGAISKCSHRTDQFTSPIFVVPKPNGSYRFILNLKKLNEYINTDHFKLEDIRTATKLMTKDCYMASIDLKEAYLSVPIGENSKKFLRFKFENKLYEFNAMPYGLCVAPFVFTKLLKPICTYLRNRNIILTSYLDDSLFFNKSKTCCSRDIVYACDWLTNLGFVINFEKSNLIPRQSCRYLGFNLDSKNLSLSVPSEKQTKIIEIISSTMRKSYSKIRDISQLIGSLNSICPAVPYGWVYTKLLEREKYLALLQSKDDYEAIMSITDIIKSELQWWYNNINKFNLIKQHNFQLEIHSDASTTGWGCVCDSKKASGPWSQKEKQFHINYLELKAAYLGLQCMAKNMNNCEILLRIDNTTAVAYINKMGGIQFPHLNSITRLIWQWCEQRNIWIFASYINTKDNFEADRESRKINIEWELSSAAFNKIIEVFGIPEIDLFASRVNKKCKKFVSWKCDPESFAVDAFTINWKDIFFYAFPPFSLVLKCLHKIRSDKAIGILVFPYWPSQPWFPLIKLMAVKDLVLFNPHKDLLSSPFRAYHPLHQQLTLAAGLLSAKHI